MIDRGLAKHARGLSGIRIEAVTLDDLNAMVLPVLVLIVGVVLVVSVMALSETVGFYPCAGSQARRSRLRRSAQAAGVTPYCSSDTCSIQVTWRYLWLLTAALTPKCLLWTLIREQAAMQVALGVVSPRMP